MIQGVDPRVALSVAKVESNYNQELVGSKGEVGVFQVLPSKDYSKKLLKDTRCRYYKGGRELKVGDKIIFAFVNRIPNC